MHFVKVFLIIFCSILFELDASAQNLVIDSLHKALKKSKEDTTKADIYLKLCTVLQEDKPDSAIYYATQSVFYAIKSNDKLRKGNAMQQKGVSFDYYNNLDSCLYCLKEAENIFATLGLIDKQSNAISDYGMAYYYRGNYEIALRNYLKSLALRKQIGDKKIIAKSLNNIGLVYRSKKDFKNALNYYRLSLAIKEEIKDELGIMNTMINMGSAYLRSDLFDSALYYTNKAKLLAEKLKSPKDIINCKGNLAGALISLKRANQAKPLLLEAEKEALAIDYKAILPTIYESLGTISVAEKNIPKALDYFQKGLAILKQGGSKESMAIYYKTMSKIYLEQGEYKTAYSYLEKSKILYDTLMNIENSRQINEMTAVYESTEKEKEIQKLQTIDLLKTTELKARKNERNYFILSTLLFIGLAGLAYKAFTSNRKKKNQLNIQNAIIEKSLEEKEILLKEIHHRVKNNLQIVSSLLSLQSNYISDEKALDAVLESKHRVQSMAIIHQNLYQDESLVNIDVKEYVEKLVEYLFHSYNIHPENIKLEMDIQPLRLDVDTLVPLGLVLNELINNCLKYAFPNLQKGKIKVMLKLENTALKLSVYDNGIGIQEDGSHFDQNSFGHKMINAFMKKLKGDIRIYNEDGTKVDIEIKNFKIAN